ncbi:hypothetical protein Cenrod_2091 [Candidatus Symbiobacter mobilis CR]|uniref:Uncharacterized protein n=1 Tax=Candidatus Symbiobacter mobilis CR TaxID=946483 RepID=U5N9S9_9BURK|nr:hypothetical protein Cenrod_2091 [Candidatus Symbiobacter mobilis CR]
MRRNIPPAAATHPIIRKRFAPSGRNAPTGGDIMGKGDWLSGLPALLSSRCTTQEQEKRLSNRGGARQCDPRYRHTRLSVCHQHSTPTGPIPRVVYGMYQVGTAQDRNV